MEPTFDPGIPAAQPTQAAPLQGGVSVTDVRPAKSFQSIIDENADVWPTLKPEQVQKAATTYLDKFVHPLPGFQALNDEQKNNFYTEFNKKYDVGHVQTEQGPLGALNTGINTATLYAGSVIDPALKTASFGLLDAPKYMSDLAKQGYPGIENDPGALGDAYRMHQNPYANMVGQATGAAGSVVNLAKGIGGWALPAFSGASNAVNVAQGNATPLQGIGQTAVDTATGFLPGGKSFLGNVVKQGLGGAAGGAASSAVNDLATGQRVDAGRAINEARSGAIMGAGMGAGIHLAHRPASVPKTNRLKYGEFEKAQSVGVHSPGAPKNVRTIQGMQAEKLQQGVQGKLNQASQFQSVTERQTLQARIAALKKQYEGLSNVANDIKAPPKVASRAKKMQAKILELHNRLSEEHQQKHGKVKKAGKEPLEHLTKPEDVKALVGLVKEMRAKGNTKQADVAMGKFSRETKAKVYDEVKRQEAHDKARHHQAKGDNKALTKAESTDQKKGNKQLAEDIATRTKEEAQLAKKEAVQKKSGDQILGIFDDLTKKPETKKGTATEYQAGGKDEYAKMGQQAKEATTQAKREQSAEKSNAKEGESLLGALKQATKAPAEKAGTAVEYRAPGKDEYARMAEEAKKQKATQATEGDTLAPGRKKSELTRKDFMSTAKMRQTVKEANTAGESVRIRYRAERTGETGEVEHKTLHDVKIIEGKNGSETKWKGIQVDGQDHHYIERNANNDMNDSNIISVERTGEKVKYKREVHPETGSAQPVDVETGEFIPQVYKRGVKSSDIRATLSDIVQKINENKRVRVDEVMSAARELEAKTMKENLGSMPANARTNLYEKTTGRPC